ncbi:dihydropteroate synthase [Taibaiella sp. KBW10]|uniref:dihydropteroate synthase n=1 Tax=Taibaiella sp. KBW10 TaxID=2153357 RepID=UPI000F5B7994|nr:dihydropteroate synthase [Taibaiella sp. KBW10]RQO32405.1 dihydropteroate synthase [Taibaiella sp. KBW10]
MIHTINCKGSLLHLEQPIVMGILNATPDSFYTKGKNNTTAGLLEQAAQMLAAGATILDVGGVSTRPKAPEVSLEEELNRVIPLIKAIKVHFPKALISIDTFRAAVAREAVAAGAAIVNDISGGTMDPEMLQTIADLKVSYILTHIKGTPADMQEAPAYDDVVLDVMDFFIEKLQLLASFGVKDVILDVGFGFGKTLAHNYTLLQHMDAFAILNRPVLMGISRKSMVYKVLNSNAANALNGTTALHSIGLLKGAQILRVHDVQEAVETISLHKMLSNQQ